MFVKAMEVEGSCMKVMSDSISDPEGLRNAIASMFPDEINKSVIDWDI